MGWVCCSIDGEEGAPGRTRFDRKATCGSTRDENPPACRKDARKDTTNTRARGERDMVSPAVFDLWLSLNCCLSRTYLDFLGRCRIDDVELKYSMMKSN